MTGNPDTKISSAALSSERSAELLALDRAIATGDKAAILATPIRVAVEHYSRKFYGENDAPLHDLAHLLLAGLTDCDYPMKYVRAQRCKPLYVASFEAEYLALAYEFVLKEYKGGWDRDRMVRCAEEAIKTAETYNNGVLEDSLNKLGFDEDIHVYVPLNRGIRNYIDREANNQWKPEAEEIIWHIERAIALCDSLHAKHAVYPAEMEEYTLLNLPFSDFHIEDHLSPWDKREKNERQALYEKHYKSTQEKAA